MTGFASLKALKNISDDHIEQIKRNTDDWKLGDMQQLCKLSSEIDGQEQSFLDELNKIKRKKTSKRRASVEIDEILTLQTPNGTKYVDANDYIKKAFCCYCLYYSWAVLSLTN